MKKLLLSVLVAFFAILSGNAAKVYFDNTNEWDKVYGYSWNPAYLQELQKITIDGHELYEAELDNEKIIFVAALNASGTDVEWSKGQTDNLEVIDGAVYNGQSAKVAMIIDGKYTEVVDVTPTVYFDNTDTGWEKVYAHAWDPVVEEELSPIEIDGHTLYAYSTKKENILYRSTLSEWDNDKQTANLKVVDGMVYGAASLKSKGGSTDAIAVIANGSYNELGQDPYAKIYLLSSRNEFAQSADFKMATTDGKTYTLAVPDADPDYTFKFFVIFPDGTYRYFSNGNDEIHNETFRISTDEPKNMSLHMGGDVTFTVKFYNNNEGIEVTVAGQIHPEDDEFAPLYLIDEESGWNTKEANKLTTTDGKTYTITKENLTADYQFKFFGRDDHKHYFSNGLGNLKNDTEYTLGIDPATGNMSLDAGGASVTFTLVLKEDHSSATLTVTGQDVVADEYPRMYLIGERTNNYSIMEKYRMSTTDGVTYTLTVPDMSTKSFRFCGDNTEVRNLGGAGAKLANGTYDLTASDHAMTLATGGEVTFTLVQSDNFASAKLTIEGQSEIEEPGFDEMYLIGVDGWDVDKNANPMTTTDGQTYTIKKYIPANKTFKIFGGAWGTRELTMKEGLKLEDGTYDVMPIKSDENGDYNMSLKTGGNVTLTLVRGNDAFTEAKLTIAGQEANDPGMDPADFPATLYLVGEVNGNEWTPENAIAMTTESVGVYTLSKAKIDGPADNTGLFSFVSKQGSWSDCGIRFGDAAGDGGKMTPDEDGVIRGDILVYNENAFEIENGIYDIKVNLNTLKLTVTKSEAGEDDPIVTPPVEDDAVYTYLLHGATESGDEAEWRDYPMENIEGIWTVKLDTPLAQFGIKEMKEDGEQNRWISSADGTSIDKDGVFGAKAGGTNWSSSISGTPTYMFDPEAMTLTVSGSTGVNAIAVEEGDAVYFNLQGQRVANPDKGIYIRVVNGKAQKVVK